MATFKKYKDKKTGVMLWEWRGHIGIDPITGERKNSGKKGFPTKRDAIQDYEKKRHALQNNILVTGDKITFKQLLESFFEYKKDKIKESSLRAYKNALISLHHKGLIDENKRISSFSIAYCQNIYEGIKSHLKRPKWYLTMIKTIFNYGVKMELITSNPFSKVDTTERQANKIKKKDFFERDELKAFMNSAKTLKNNAYFYLFTLLARTGMRQGEARALKWSDINFFNHTISINKTVTNNKDNIEVIGDTPKNEASYRTIIMDHNTEILLNEWKQLQQEASLKRGKPIKKDSLLFTSYKGGIISPVQCRNAMKVACDRANVPYISLHGLRHTYVSLMIEAGESPINIAHTVGHSDTKMIMKVYDAMTENRQQQTAEKFAQYIGNF